MLMSYQVLARKYRPRNFRTIIGQEHIVQALICSLREKRLHHAYLFTGTRGVGKTTLSRILAKSLNCCGRTNTESITVDPCGLCEVCVAIDTGRFIDYIEIDAASNRGIDEITQLLQQAIYAPCNADFKIYMIDEVHMLTTYAFNAMLKILEEPPLHVKFILATTDVQKIPETVISRCLQFNLKRMQPHHIVRHLNDILQQENIRFEDEVLSLLARAAHGSMRDALSLTDQAINYATSNCITLNAARNMIGSVDQMYLIRLLETLILQDGVVLLALIDEIATYSLSYNVVLQDLATVLYQISLVQIAPSALSEDVFHKEKIMQLATKFSPEEIQLFYQISVHGRNELDLAPDEYTGFSMTLLRMLAFRPITAQESHDWCVVPNDTGANSHDTVIDADVLQDNGSSKIDINNSNIYNTDCNFQLRNITVQEQKCISSVKYSQNKKSVSLSYASPLDLNKTSILRNKILCTLDTQFQKTFISYSPQQVSINKSSKDVNATTIINQSTQILEELNWNGNLSQLATRLPLRGIVYQIIQHSQLVCCVKYQEIIFFYLRIPLKTFCSANIISRLNQVLSVYFGSTIQVKAGVDSLSSSFNYDNQANLLKKKREIEHIINSNPFIQTILHEFNAYIVPGSIKSV